MSYSKRIPPIKINLDVDNFNKLIEILNNIIDCDNEYISEKSIKLKDKLLRFSVPTTNEKNTNIVDIRFYNNEMVDMFYILFYGIKDTVFIETDYYDMLLRIREKIKEERKNN